MAQAPTSDRDMASLVLEHLDAVEAEERASSQETLPSRSPAAVPCGNQYEEVPSHSQTKEYFNDERETALREINDSDANGHGGDISPTQDEPDYESPFSFHLDREPSDDSTDDDPLISRMRTIMKQTRPKPQQTAAMEKLHPFVSLLTLGDLERCLTVEAAFPPEERCSEEKLRYRLTVCPELTLGVFTIPPRGEWPNGVAPEHPTLVAHLIASRTASKVVTDASMEVPKNWETEKTSRTQPGVGHDDEGQTLAIHSLAVLPEHQGKRIGPMLLKSWLQRIKDAAIAQRVALLAHDHLIPFYESFGFRNLGPSDCKFGGGGWHDMVLEFSEVGVGYDSD
ncbi:hypothetical protein KEM52_005908 [Ascosphaera acerosa]|nr:hypothetical protein KEM52_005908 [Ascosphaera acerosa]